MYVYTEMWAVCVCRYVVQCGGDVDDAALESPSRGVGCGTHELWEEEEREHVVAQVVGLPLQLLAIHSQLPRREGHYTYTEREEGQETGVRDT